MKGKRKCLQKIECEQSFRMTRKKVLGEGLDHRLEGPHLRTETLGLSPRREVEQSGAVPVGHFRAVDAELTLSI